MDWIIVAYYTEAYSKEIEGLRASLDEFDLPFYIEKADDLGGWDANTHYKPTFIRDCLDMFPSKNIIYVDADARFEQYPELFDILDCDIAYWVNTYPEGKRHEICSGTLFLANNDKARNICDSWIDLCKDISDTLEQYKLGVAMSFIENLLSVTLPVEYCCIFDHPLAQGKTAVIKQLQASRRLRK